MVSCYVVYIDTEIWDQCTWVAARAWAWQLSHIMDMAS